MPVSITYFGIKARNLLPILICEVGGVEYEFVNAAGQWPEPLKSQSPFGQLPFLVDGDLRIGQSLAIARYLARKVGILGDSDAEYGQSEQITQEMEDIYMGIAKAQNSPDKAAGYAEFFQKLNVHLTNLQKLLKGDRFTSKLTLGELAIFSIFNIIADFKPDFLGGHPQLQSFYNSIGSIPQIKAFFENPKVPLNQYFKIE
eukprot:NODE_7570_length_763_cov_47.534375_g6958_i0.p1 GENE.NODE_7570_length_763_cov_47.534375_g6958_i0~~NODE_7570_length_763_cov_47.534375_g6958_i0.p1  ORF type:complete len:201 (-),score=42.14 NODE_7570_length_763_cov_47.534375_g6958_i0:96-698(-)